MTWWWSADQDLGPTPPSPVRGWWQEDAPLLRARRRMIRLAAEKFLSLVGPPGRGVRYAPEHLGLAYHGLCDASGAQEGDYDAHLLVSEPFFRHQLHLISRLFTARLARDVLHGREQGARLTAMISFDDGLRSVESLALAPLAEYGLPATLFLNDIAWERQELWHDTVARAALSARPEALEAALLGVVPTLGLSWLPGAPPVERAMRLVELLKSLPGARALEVAQALGPLAGPPPARYMEPDAVRRAHEAGHEIGGHSHRHLILTLLEEPLRERELVENKCALEEVVGEPIVSFAHPNGDYNPASLRAVSRAGYRNAWGVERAELAPMALARRNISDAACVDEEGRFSGALFLLWLFRGQGGLPQ